MNDQRRARMAIFGSQGAAIETRAAHSIGRPLSSGEISVDRLALGLVNAPGNLHSSSLSSDRSLYSLGHRWAKIQLLRSAAARGHYRLLKIVPEIDESLDVLDVVVAAHEPVTPSTASV